MSKFTSKNIDQKQKNSDQITSSSVCHNAFEKPMKSKQKAFQSEHGQPRKLHSKNKFSGRNALGAYIQNPEMYDSSLVISFDQDFVLVNDMFPKSSVHMLLLPRSIKFSQLHPFEAFEDVEFLATVRLQTAKLRSIVAQELQRKYSTFSEQEKAREAACSGRIQRVEGEETPAGRNWDNDVIAGIHAGPSMNHLHVHVLSVDRFSPFLKHRKHFNSFATPFFIPIEDFPLAKDDARRHPGREGYLAYDLKCWRCGRNFENKFSKLKDHLALEFEEWKKV